MFKTVCEDLRRWVVPGQIVPDAALTWPVIVRLFFYHLPVRAVVVFRLANWCKRHRVPFFPGFLQRYIYQHYGLEISSGAEIGGGLYIAHPVGCVIGARKIGRNCSVIAAVTIGMRNTWAFPVIGDNVTIGAGARVLGDLRIGNDVTIGANAVVIHDVPDGATVVGMPARPIKIYGQPLIPVSEKSVGEG